MRVLVVEDHAELAQSVARVLRREGMAVDVTYDGADALERTAVVEYDVVVLDRDLPGVHGDAVKELPVGQPVLTKANVPHWHGAAPDQYALQFSVYAGKLEWQKPVTDAEYKGK